jgi:hypothetical protein
LNTKDRRSSMTLINGMVLRDLKRCESECTIVLPDILSKVSTHTVRPLKKTSQTVRRVSHAG